MRYLIFLTPEAGGREARQGGARGAAGAKQLEAIRTRPGRQQTGNSLGPQSCRKEPPPPKCLAAPPLCFDSVSAMAVEVS